MLKWNLIANYLGQGWVALMGLVFVPFYIRYLGVETYGLIGIFALIQTWVAVLDMGMSPTLSREIARFTGGEGDPVSIRDLLRSVEVVAISAALLVSCGIALASGWIATAWLQSKGLPISSVAQAVSIMGIVASLRFVEGIYRGCITCLQRQVLFNLIASAMASLRGGGAVLIVAFVSPTIQAFFIWQGVISLCTILIFAAVTYSVLPAGFRSGRFSLDALRGVSRFAGGMMGVTLSALLLTQLDKIFLSRLISLTDFGYYTLATLAASVLYILIYPISAAWIPRLCQLEAARDVVGLSRAYHLGAQIVSVGAGSAAVVLIAFPDLLLTLWTHDQDLASHTAPLLRLLAFANLLNGLMALPHQTQLAHKWTGLALRINCVGIVVVAPVMWWASLKFGALGAATVLIGLNLIYLLTSAHYMFQRILCKEQWVWYREDILFPIAVAASVAAVFHQALPPVHGTIAQLGAIVSASALVLAAASLAATRVRVELRRVLCSRLPAGLSRSTPLLINRQHFRKFVRLARKG